MTEERRRSIWLYAMLGSPLMLPIGSMIASLYRQNTDIDLWWVAFLQLLGSVFGSVMAGLSAHRFGRKHAIMVQGLIFTATFVSSCFTDNEIATSIAAFLNGISFSGMLIVLMVYFVEIGQWHNRGRFCAALHLFYNVGFLLQYPLDGTGLLIYRIIVQIIFSVLLIVFYRVAPETPQYLMSRSAWEQAEMSLKMLRSKDYNTELQQIYAAVTSTKKCFTAWFFVILIFICANLSGINIAIQMVINRVQVDYYLFLFIMYVSPLVGSLFTFFFIDRVGRNKILIISTLGVLTCELLIASFMYTTNLNEWSWFVITTMTMLKWLGGMGFAGLPFIVCAEILLSNKKALTLGLTAALGWLASFVIFLLYDYLVTIIGIDIFWLFPTVNMLALTFYGVYIPETAWKSVKDLNEMFDK